MEHLRFLCVLNESTSNKSTSLLLTSLSTDETSAFDVGLARENPTYLLQFCSEALAKTPSAFTIAQAEKSAYAAGDHSLISSAPFDAQTSSIAANDVYFRFLAHFSSTHKIQFIHPCTITHIRKYMSVPLIKVIETPQLYLERVKPWIDSIPASRTSWINKIVKKEAEVEDIIHFEDGRNETGCGFVVLPDSKWDRTTVANLYWLVITNDGSRLKSLRDLRGSDVPYLEHIKAVVESLLLEKYGLGKDGVRLFVHYQPSYYHFHIHVVNLQMEATGGMAAGQAHLLEDVIDSLKLDGDFYARRTMTYFLGQTHELVPILKIE